MKTKESNKIKSFISETFKRLLPYIFLFFIFAFVGWISESIFCFIKDGDTAKRGFLYGPICPIYGYGGLMLMLYFYKTSSKPHNYFKLFFMFIFIFSLFEYFVGFALEAIFCERWWDYSDDIYSINGRITILNSFLWGVATIIFAKFVYPFTRTFKDKFLPKIPNLVKNTIAIIFITIYVTDSLLSCLRYLYWK